MRVNWTVSWALEGKLNRGGRAGSEVLEVAVTENHRPPIGKEIVGHVPHAFGAASRDREYHTCKSRELQLSLLFEFE